ncbi:MAG: ABC transporter substrate-binding protein [Burkholderiaceae bacterium]|jgi:branched-chain amino acid transport system substrate-binding protein|uniref:ABC transporter substrate-binding protein n=1 Tax=Herminiimonas contaminans TaxID=1111140 RepID=A0ABS0EMX2_9BURK|nr:ABC transporter substrate-binding protein [Herminiimonas contaminans]MBF8176198.1 ABC transporter substrate-binding protein [Herminiimonas contaminans]MBX9799343.1 ABC transporter substrate-binding protein [Burkholderiaceae bacterium]
MNWQTSKSWAASLGFAMLTATSAYAQETIKIGVSEPLTGPVAASGTYVTNGARIAADYVNQNGGVLGKKLQLVIEDNKSNPREAVNSVEKLILKDKVPVLMGAWSSTFTLAVMPKLMEYGVPMVVETASSSKITTAGNPWVFRTSPTSAMEAKAFAKLIDSYSPAIKKVDFLAVNNDWGLGAAVEFKKMLEAKGIAIGRTETMTPDMTDLSAQLAALKGSGSDTVIVTSGIEQLTLAIRQAGEQRLPQRIITTGGSFPEPLLKTPGPKGYVSQHLLFFAPWAPERAKHPAIAKAFMDGWKARGLEFAGQTEGFRGFDAILTIAEAIRVSGKAEPAAIRDALWKVQVQGANGDIAFGKEGPAGKESGQAAPNVYVVELKDGQVSVK